MAPRRRTAEPPASSAFLDALAAGQHEGERLRADLDAPPVSDERLHTYSRDRALVKRRLLRGRLRPLFARQRAYTADAWIAAHARKHRSNATAAAHDLGLGLGFGLVVENGGQWRLAEAEHAILTLGVEIHRREQLPDGAWLWLVAMDRGSGGKRWMAVLETEESGESGEKVRLRALLCPPGQEKSWRPPRVSTVIPRPALRPAGEADSPSRFGFGPKGPELVEDRGRAQAFRQLAGASGLSRLGAVTRDGAERMFSAHIDHARETARRAIAARRRWEVERREALHDGRRLAVLHLVWAAEEDVVKAPLRLVVAEAAAKEAGGMAPAASASHRGWQAWYREDPRYRRGNDPWARPSYVDDVDHQALAAAITAGEGPAVAAALVGLSVAADAQIADPAVADSLVRFILDADAEAARTAERARAEEEGRLADLAKARAAQGPKLGPGVGHWTGQGGTGQGAALDDARQRQQLKIQAVEAALQMRAAIDGLKRLDGQGRQGTDQALAQLAAELDRLAALCRRE